MAVFRETPYSAFNFLVDLEPGQGEEVQAGFSEVSGLNARSRSPSTVPETTA